MNPVFHLYQLQKIDTQLLGNSNRLHTIDAMLLNDNTVKRAKFEVDRISSELNTLLAASRELDEKILSRRNKLEQSESSLYSGTIKNPKELQDLQKEITFIKSNIADLEDEQLDVMIKIDSAQDIHNSSLELLKSAQIDFESRNHTLINEKQQLSYENARLSEEREMITSQISTELLSSYEVLRSKKNSIAISRVEDQTCSVCGSTLTPAECQSAKASTGNIRCSVCGRILYAD